MLKLIKKMLIFTFVFSMFAVNVSAEQPSKDTPISNRSNEKVLNDENFELSNLQFLIESVDRDSSQYTDESYQVLKVALEKAEETFLKPQDQTSIDNAADELFTAINNLADNHRSKLENLLYNIEEIRALVDEYNLDVFTLTSRNDLNVEITNAKVFLQEQPSNQGGANTVYKSLIKAFENLEETVDLGKKPNQLKKEVKELLDKVDTLYPYDYTNESFKYMQKAAELAKKNSNYDVEKDNVIPDRKLLVSKQILSNSINNLKTVESNKAKLENLIKDVESLDLSLYEKAEQKEFSKTLDKAKKLLKEKVNDGEDVDEKESLKKLDDNYNETMLDLSNKKDSLKLLVLEDENIEEDIEEENNAPIVPPTDNEVSVDQETVDTGISNDTYIFVTIFAVGVLVIAYLGYSKYKKDKKE